MTAILANHEEIESHNIPVLIKRFINQYTHLIQTPNTGAFIGHKADIEANDNEENTPMDIAAEYGNKEIVDILKDKWEEGVYEKNSIGYPPPLYKAALKGHNKILFSLLDKSMVEVKDEKERSILHIMNKNSDIIFDRLVKSFLYALVSRS